MTWSVSYSRKAEKQQRGLPVAVKNALLALEIEIRELGPVRGNWKNYSKLTGNRHHCHIKTGRPTYVAVWEEMEGSIKLVEIEYVGTHEKAPY